MTATGGRVSATSETAPRGRWAANGVLVVVALALGLGLAFGFHAAVDDASGTAQPAGEGVRGSLAHAVADRAGAIGPSGTDSGVTGGVPAVEPPSAAPRTPDAAVGTFLAREVAQDF